MKRKRKEAQVEISAAAWEERSLERFKPLLSVEEFTHLVEEIKLPLATTFRFNPLKTTREAILRLEKRYNWRLEPSSFCPTGFRVDAGESSMPASQTLEHKMGHYYIQEEASMLPVELFTMDAGAPELCLDMAASPGGKTTHLISRGGDRSLVFANDSSAGRIQALRIVLQNWGATNCAVTQFPGESFGSWFPNLFDRVLIDAPCSMQGLRTTETHDVRPVTDKEISSLAKRQVALLTSALQAVKLGGEVVYSTCTLVPDEDEAVIDAILGRFTGAVEIVKTGIAAPGLLSDGRRKFDPEVQNAVRLWPNRLHTAGFFACLLRKTGELEVRHTAAPSRPLERTGFAPLRVKDCRRLIDDLLDTYQFELAEVLERYRLVLVSYGQKIYAFSERLIEDFASLPVQSAGLLVGEEKVEGFVPAHEWISRFFDGFAGKKIVVQDDQFDAWMRGEDLAPAANLPSKAEGIVLMIDTSGRFLGRGKLSGGRIKNLLPHRLV